MITAYHTTPSGVRPRVVAASDAWPEGVVWLDVFEPTREEELAVEQFLGLEIPTKLEMRDIELSSRLYQEDGGLFMTATMVIRADSGMPERADVTFILTRHTLCSLRYFEAKPFKVFAASITKNQAACATPEAALRGLIDAIIDRLADVLQELGARLDQLSTQIFRHPTAASPGGTLPPRSPKKQDGDLQDILDQLGTAGDLLSRARESLVSIGRLITFLISSTSFFLTPEMIRHLKSSGHDQQALADYASFLSSKVTFFLDATLGMINVEQNKIIKIFSVASVMFLPPTLVASTYGMNFTFMPELDWASGYPFALALMLLSALIPYAYFRRRGWL